MSKKTCIIIQDLVKEHILQVKEIIPNWKVIVGKDKSRWINDLKEAEIIVGWKNEVNDQCVKGDGNLRWIQSWSAGVNYFPQTELAEKNILLTSANGVHAYPISETIFALMLALTRKIHTYVKNQQKQIWHHENMNLEIHEKTIGIIGVGAIGTETAKIAKAFGMKVIGIRHSGRPEQYVDEMYKQAQLNSILPQCDYIVNTLPLTKETYHLFSKEQFKRMKKSSYFINIGRGDTVDEAALSHALENEEIAGAGLDVFETEPLPKESPLWKLENVIITPHTSGSTEYYERRVIKDIFIPNLKQYVVNEMPSLNLVDYQKGY